MYLLRYALLLITLAACDSARPPADPDRVMALNTAATPAASEWRHYLGDQGSSQYSPLAQINRDNVSRLEVAWRYDAGDAGEFDTTMTTNPLVVGGVLYALSAKHKYLFALDAATGEELWLHDFGVTDNWKGAGRGLVYWQGELPDGTQANWIIAGIGHRLFAVDARSGDRASAFGDGGSIDLRHGLDRTAEEVHLYVSSPGTLYGDLLIQGFGAAEFYGAPPGYIRAYRLPGGELAWTFRSIPRPGEFGADTWPAQQRHTFGGANSWAGITVDEERGIAYVPTGSASYDYYGHDRAGDNLFANSLLALDAATGERLWHYQVVRHDLWDRDLPSPPNLVTVERDGRRIPAVSQATKSGHLFLFDRASGQPLFPMAEVPVTGPALPGEHPAASQPLPLAPPPFANQHFQVTDVDPDSTGYIGELIHGMTHNAPFPAPNEEGVVLYPGLDGGAEWGGQAWDKDSGLLFVNTTEIPWYFTMVPTSAEGFDVYSLEFAYLHFCGSCHGADREGNGDIFPALKNIGERYWPWEVWDIMRHGRGRMPAFSTEPWYYLAGPLLYLYTAEDDAIARRRESGEIGGYMTDGFNILYDEFGLPGSKPPWGSLVAIDVNRGVIAWKVPLGDYPQALRRGLSGLGAENYGGPVVTAGGLVFIAATPDRKIRAFDKRDGTLLWQDELPAAGFATPAVYEAGGRQFVVVAAGGGKVGQPSGSTYVAYALPDGKQ